MPPPPVVAVAASGGRDSTALLHCTARMAAGLGIQVHALHVHHGLQAAADDWLRRIGRQCGRWARAGLPIHFHSHRLNGAPAPGESVEAWARRERYRALTAMARDAGCDAVLLAHHRRDQAETFLLQALRAGGPAGLSAMPRETAREGIVWLRPWLDHPRESIEAYLLRHRLSFIDDASNADPRFARNRLRQQVWPALASAFEGAEASLAGAARRAQEAAMCLEELAAIDMAATVAGNALLMPPWQALSSARRANLLRAWLGGTCPGPVPETLVQRLARELPQATIARWPAPGGELRLHDGRLVHAATAWSAPEGPGFRLDLSRPGGHEVAAWGGRFDVEAAPEGGVPAHALRDAEIRPRQGGERFQGSPHSVPRSLKKQYQAMRVPAWQRTGPLLFFQDRLLFVPGLGIDARWLGDPGEPRLLLRWQAGCTLPGSRTSA